MSEPKEITREEMLRFFDAMIELTCMVDKEMVMSIRKLIEQPTVSEMEFDIAANLAIVALDKLPKSEHYKILKSMIKQLGIRMEGE